MNTLKEYYNRRKTTPLYWHNKSSDLRASAGVMWFAMQTENSEKIVKKLNLGHGFSLPVACHQSYYRAKPLKL